ncbi:MAG: hypothetical protein J6J74_06125 [Elusimicrobiaceae bacterium]|nr:hypothetical protein [Elusimicrobiaceae bacterium]MBP3514037.1 hypothetical protein [Elusimicrobiaceae bacterium]
MNPLQENIQTAVTRIGEFLAQNGKATSWQLKVTFRLSASVLYLALGALYQQGKISLEADGINYHVTWTAGVQTPRPEASAPQAAN